MQTEIEIKFFVARDIQESLSNLLNSLEIISSSRVELGNVYFDTSELDLRRLDMGLRIRRSDKFSEQTIKCRGQVVGGLHARPEYNAPVSGALPTLAAFPTEIWPSLELRDAIQGLLVAQFRTDFVRRYWLIAFEGAEIELAWDRGEIVGSLGRSEIDELELELKSGTANALFALAARLAGLGGVRLGAQSKAQRGYRLAGLGKPLAVQPLPDVGGLAAAACITLGLQHWQHHEQLWLESEGVERQQALAGIVQGVTLLSEAAATLAVAPSWLPPLLARHASLAQEADGERLSALLHGADYVGLQLAIAAWLHLGH
ncbi:inorganic triphosphatase [Aeromonas sp. sif2433]|uniref:CYTH domain-containing protein n=1 Tax=Aeromonas sp. sif2433 TaxID=2854794 RepID=UPI001C48CD44|nr:CYTH domain-containing protein [Aeromonas sp. sif2433]MBV7415366.1 CYTH domain-containing protein [Aeromonas sp. sif2433]